MHTNVLKIFIREVLSGFKSFSATGSDRALGNLRQGVATTGQKNKGIFADIEEEESWEDEVVNTEDERVPFVHGTISR